MKSPRWHPLTPNGHKLLSPLAVVLGILGWMALLIVALSEGWLIPGSVVEALVWVGLLCGGAIGCGLGLRALFRRVPVRCPACGGGAYFLSEKGSGSEQYRCRECGGIHRAEADPGRVFGGVLFTIAGLAMSMLGIQESASGGAGEAWPAVVFGLVFVCVGLLGGGAGGWLLRRIRPVFPALAGLPWDQLLGGGAAAMVGIGLFLVAALDPREDAFPAGRLPVVLAGGAFFLAGLAILYPACTRKGEHSAAARVIGLLLLACLLGVPAAVFLDWRTLKLLAVAVSIVLLAWGAWRLWLRDILPKRVIHTPAMYLLAATLPLLAGLAFSAGWWLHRVLAPADREPSSLLAGTAEEPMVGPPGADLEARFRFQTWGERTAAPACRVTIDPPLRPRPGERYWITVVPAGREDGAYDWWQYVESGTSSVNIPFPPLPGEYEIRLHARYPTEPYHVVWREPWTIHPPPAEAESGLR